MADIVGQGHITDILQRSLKAGKIAHAYLFTGPRGVGKTSIARILAHEINHLPYTDDEQHLDIIEIDAASNNGVDDVRLLREKVQIAPVSAHKKIYIIDEVHMLSKPAFNALLKTLEEPPAHVVFILATTDVNKLPATIVSRTQRYSFRAISAADIVQHLRYIATQESIAISDQALQLIAQRSEGSFRDSISMLDQLSSLADDGQEITAQLVELSLGLAPNNLVESLLQAVDQHNIKQLAELLTQCEADGLSATVVCGQLTTRLRQLAPEQPSVLPLLDVLLDVPKSTQPYSKLLSTLGLAALQTGTVKPKNAPLMATPSVQEPHISATVKQLQAIKKSAQSEQPKSAESNESNKSVEANEPTESDKLAELADAGEKAALHELSRQATKKHPKISPLVPPADFNWEALLTQAHDQSVALYTVLAKCEPELTPDGLTLYTTNAFYKKKIDDPKYLSHLYEALKACGSYQLTVHTVPTRAPMKNSKVAAIADIMGGGIEVTP